MIAFPLDEAHLEALREACALVIDEPAKAEQMRLAAGAFLKVGAVLIPSFAAHYALSSPTSAASLVRDLLARAGWPQFATPGHYDASTSAAVYPMGTRGIRVVSADERWREFKEDALASLILAFLDLAHGDRDGATRALREVGR